MGRWGGARELRACELCVCELHTQDARARQGKAKQGGRGGAGTHLPLRLAVGSQRRRGLLLQHQLPALKLLLHPQALGCAPAKGDGNGIGGNNGNPFEAQTRDKRLEVGCVRWGSGGGG